MAQMLTSTAQTSKPFRHAVAILGLLVATTPISSFGQSDLRNTFPGRRIGGGTRGECSARLVANLVPANSIFAPGAGNTIGILEGPTAQPRPLQLVFKPAGEQSAASTKRNLPATEAGVTLITIPAIRRATIWETAYQCDGGEAAGSVMELDFVESASPPAQSLLVPEAKSEDQQAAASLAKLRTFCGKTVPSRDVAETFGLSDAITQEWPQQLPVRCL
jgi:hypothetical protein